MRDNILISNYSKYCIGKALLNSTINDIELIGNGYNISGEKRLLEKRKLEQLKREEEEKLFYAKLETLNKYKKK